MFTVEQPSPLAIPKTFFLAYNLYLSHSFYHLSLKGQVPHSISALCALQSIFLEDYVLKMTLEALSMLGSVNIYRDSLWTPAPLKSVNTRTKPWGRQPLYPGHQAAAPMHTHQKLFLFMSLALLLISQIKCKHKPGLLMVHFSEVKHTPNKDQNIQVVRIHPELERRGMPVTLDCSRRKKGDQMLSLHCLEKLTIPPTHNILNLLRYKSVHPQPSSVTCVSYSQMSFPEIIFTCFLMVKKIVIYSCSGILLIHLKHNEQTNKY